MPCERGQGFNPKNMDAKVEYPAGHEAGMMVPKGGSSCASCKYYKGLLKCGNEYFVKWNGAQATPPKPAGSDDIPAKSADEYCSDFYIPSKHAALSKSVVV